MELKHRCLKGRNMMSERETYFRYHRNLRTGCDCLALHYWRKSREKYTDPRTAAHSVFPILVLFPKTGNPWKKNHSDFHWNMVVFLINNCIQGTTEARGSIFPEALVSLAFYLWHLFQSSSVKQLELSSCHLEGLQVGTRGKQHQTSAGTLRGGYEC